MTTMTTGRCRAYQALWIVLPAMIWPLTALAQPAHAVLSHGAIVRMDTTHRNIALVFTGHEFADGADSIRSTLSRHSVKANFFFTGDFLRNKFFERSIRQLHAEGHFIGPHSDGHLLYCSWTDRDSLFVTQNQFTDDLKRNYTELARFGIRFEDANVFMPPYEWYNDSIAAWTRDLGITLVNFSPGTSSNADYTWPGLGRAYLTRDSIFARIVRYEQTFGFNGFILLLHIGTDPRRPDPFYTRLDELLTYLIARGYEFHLLPESLRPVRP